MSWACDFSLTSLTLVIVVACFLGDAAASTDQCPSNLPRDEFLKSFGDFCFWFHMNDRREYRAAEETCAKEGGTLVMPKTRELDQFIVEALRNDYKGNGLVWIGLNDIEDEKVFRWADGSRLRSNDYDHWSSKEGPGHIVFGGMLDCVVIDPRDRYQWHEKNCNGYFTSKENAFICQFNAARGPQPTTTQESHRQEGTILTTNDDSQTSKSTGNFLGTLSTTSSTAPEHTTTYKPSHTQTPAITHTRPTTHTQVHTQPTSTKCPVFTCKLDCALDGFKIDPHTGCDVCQCDV